MENIEKNNKLIAEFMGGKMVLENHYGINIIKIPHNKDYDLSFLKYNTSWDWLMPVVEKINIMDDYKFTVIIKSMDVEIFDNHNNREVLEISCSWQPDELLQSLYEAVVEFIKWYNKNK